MSDQNESTESKNQPAYHNEVDKDGNKYSVLRNGLIVCTSLSAALSPRKKMLRDRRELKKRQKSPPVF